MVFQILNEHSLCDYYSLNENPGLSQRIKVRKDKFAFLDDEKFSSSWSALKMISKYMLHFTSPNALQFLFVFAGESASS